jgi:hypothetical protein
MIWKTPKTFCPNTSPKPFSIEVWTGNFGMCEVGDWRFADV